MFSSSKLLKEFHSISEVVSIAVKHVNNIEILSNNLGNMLIEYKYLLKVFQTAGLSSAEVTQCNFC